MVTLRASILLPLLVLGLMACSKQSDAPPSAEKAKADKDAATKAVRDNPVYGDQFKAMDKAKAAADEAVKKTEDTLKKVEEAK